MPESHARHVNIDSRTLAHVHDRETQSLTAAFALAPRLVTPRCCFLPVAGLLAFFFGFALAFVFLLFLFACFPLLPLLLLLLFLPFGFFFGVAFFFLLPCLELLPLPFVAFFCAVLGFFFVLPLAAGAFFFGFWPHYRDASRRRRTRYALTNRRAVVAEVDRQGRVSVKSYPIRLDTPLGGGHDRVIFATERRMARGRGYDADVGFERIGAEARVVHDHIIAIKARRAAEDA